MKKWYGSAALLLGAVIWGFAFVAQSVGMEYVGPFTFQAVRSLIGAATLVPVIYVMDRHKKKKAEYVPAAPKQRKKLWMGGLCCGLALCIAANFQQMGIMYTTVGKAGFLTSMYTVIVPILGIFLHKKIAPKIWGCVVICMTGTYMLSMSEAMSLGKGDALIIICAFFFAIQIMVVDHFAKEVDGVKLSCLQFLVCGILSAVPMFLFETPSLSALTAAGASILYAGVLSCGVAYTLQIVGQKYTQPTTATLLMSMESVFSLLGGLLLLHQVPSLKEGIGCLLVFLAVVIAQL